MSKILKCAAAVVAASLYASQVFAAWEVNMPVGVTEISRDVYRLHMLIFYICVIIAVLVFGAMIASLVKFRHSQGAVAATFNHNTKVEIIWTIIPILILVGMAVPAAETLIKIEDTRASNLTVKVTGYQWKWHYDYIDHGVNFFSNLARDSDRARQLNSGINVKEVPNYLLEVDRPMVVPVGSKVRVLLTAGDVIHAWWVPDFGLKKDAIPGFVNELWFRADKPGIYRGQCTELCGRDHAFMPVVVQVLPQAEFDAWLKSQQPQGTETQPTPAAASATTDQRATLAVAQAE